MKMEVFYMQLEEMIDSPLLEYWLKELSSLAEIGDYATAILEHLNELAETERRQEIKLRELYYRKMEIDYFNS